MISEERVGWLAHRSGIKIDAFGSPVVDKFEYLMNLVRLVEEEIKERPNTIYTNKDANSPLLKSDGTPRARSGPKPGWKQRKAEQEKGQQ